MAAGLAARQSGGISADPARGVVWVSESSDNALVGFDQATFEPGPPRPLGTAAGCPGALHATASAVWVASGCFSTGGHPPGVAAFDPDTGTVTPADERLSGPLAFAASSDPNVLYVGGADGAVSRVDISDPAAGATVTQASVASPGGCDGVDALAYDPTSAELVLACGFPYEHIRVDAADLTVAGTYPTAHYPTEVSVAAGYVIAGSTWSQPGIFVFASGAAHPVEEYSSADSAYVELGGMAVSADGATAYAFYEQPGGSGVVATIVTGLATPAGKIALTVPASVRARHTLHMTGTFALSDQPTPGPTQLIVQRENPDGSTSTLPEITTSNSGAFTVSDLPTQAGQTTWSVIYQGDAGHARALETVTRTVVLPTPTLTLAAQRKTTPYATADVLTAHLSAHGSNAQVALYAGHGLDRNWPVPAS